MPSNQSPAERHVQEVLDWTTGGATLGDLDAHTLERFLWFELPTKWLIEPAERDEIVRALAGAFAAEGRDRMAERCTGEATRTVLEAWEEGRRAGFKAFDAADARSAANPPDLAPEGDFPGLAWGEVMGIVEVTARHRVGAVLGWAWERGDLTPGTRGWRGEQQRIARAVMAEPSGDPVEGGTVLEAIHAERLQTWVTRHRSPTATSLLTRLAKHLLHPVALPPGAAEATAPLAELLDACADGLTLTAKHYLPPALARRLAGEHGWALDGFPGRGEIDEPLVTELREMATRARLVRRSKRRLLLTPAGERARVDAETRWRVAAHSWIAGDDFDAAAGEIALALLVLDGAPGGYGALDRRVAPIMAELGWRAGHDEPVNERDVGWAIGALYRRGAIHGFVDTDAGLRSGLSPLGRAAALTALRARALAPRRDLP